MAKGKGGPRDPLSNPQTMGREGMRILRAIAFGSFNIYNEGHIFRNIEFDKATLTEIDKRLLDVNIHIAALKCAYNGTTDPNVLRLMMDDEKKQEAYNIMRDAICRIIISNGDTGFLWVLSSKLPKFKYNI